MSEKLTHAQAGYRQEGSPTQHCIVCTMYRDHNRCTAVVDIKWFGWCKLFEPEGRKRHAESG